VASGFLHSANGLAADTLADKETARALFNEGNGFRDAGDLRAAVDKYKVAYALYPTPIIGLELGRAHVGIGELLEARQVLTSIEKLPLKGDQSGRANLARSDARTLSEILVTRIPAVKVVVPGIESTPARVVKVDGVVVPNEVLLVPRRLNPGNHTIELFDGNATSPLAIVNFALAERETKEVTVMPTASALVQPQPMAGAPIQPPPSQQPMAAAPIQQPPIQQATVVVPMQQPSVLVPSTHVPPAQPMAMEPRMGQSDPKRPPTAHLHDRFYLRMGIGAGSTSHNLTEQGMNGDINEVGALIELAAGWTISNSLVLGLGLYDAYTSKDQYGKTVTVSTSVVGPMVDWYVSPTGGFHIQAAVGGSVGSTTVTGSPDVSLSGAGFMLGAGYSAWIGNEWGCGAKLMILRTSTTDNDAGADLKIQSTAVGVLAEFTLN
jgi:hypothetical protein